MHRIVNLPDIRPPDIRQLFLLDTGYPAGYPVMAGYPAKSALNNKFLPEFRAFNYQIKYTVVSASISIYYSILTIRGSKLNLKKMCFLTTNFKSLLFNLFMRQFSLYLAGYPVPETGYPAGYRIAKKAGYPVHH